MNTDPKSPSTAEVIDEVSKWGVGAGIITVALAPLAIPILVLTGATLALLLVAVIPLALIAGIVYLPVRVIRGIRRRRRPLSRGGAAEEEVLGRIEFTPAHH
jgi:hypothetical protein